ncbi:hypothetical protein MBLNU457_7264t1 [Dothideomycetes sp. NU457]
MTLLNKLRSGTSSRASSRASSPKPTPPPTTTKALIPLYIYPLNGESWKPLYDSIARHPSVEFVVIVNPNSGPYAEYPNSAPGRLSLPGHDYCREIPKLTASGNVSTIGYVRIDYCKKPLSEVFAEIETYAAWSREPGLGVSGIFVDETPNHHSAHDEEYLNAIKHAIRSLSGFTGASLIMHNPGTPPDARLAQTADAVVTCEESYARYRSQEVQDHYANFHYSHAMSAYQMSGVPAAEIEWLTHALRRECGYLFVTDLVDNFYESFGSGHEKFIAALE